ncbi:MAG: sulfite exporter TauE/SafE family protein [Chloroflexota bacterium]|nr:sulfite exporter TauE/SafE family protein [Chloroflexota bacterium]
MSIAITIALGLVAGVLAGMLGIGGGVILIPGMVFFLAVDQHTAQGVSLAVIAVTALVGTFSNFRQHTVEGATALWIVPAAIVFGLLGSMAADCIDAALLRRIFGIVIVLVGLAMVLGDRRRASTTT